MSGDPNPIRQVPGLNSTDAVQKSGLISWGIARVPQLIADADELRSLDLTGQLAITLKSNGRFYVLNTLDTTTADDGEAYIRDANNLLFERVVIDGLDGADGAPGATGPQGEGLDYDVIVADITERDTHGSDAVGTRVVVSDIGDGTSAIYELESTGPAVWSDPIHIGAGSGSRTLLNADITYYIHPISGNDTTGDGSSGNPWKTPTKVWAIARDTLDLGGHNVICQYQASATITATQTFTGKLTGYGNFYIQGDYAGLDASTYSVSSTTSGVLLFYGADGARFTVRYLTLSSSGTGGFGVITSDGKVTASHIIAGAFGGSVIDASGSDAQAAINNSTLSGNIYALAIAEAGSTAFIGANIDIASAITVSGALVQADVNATIQAASASFTGSTPNGKRFNVSQASAIFPANPADLNFFPGTSKGTIDSSSAYGSYGAASLYRAKVNRNGTNQNSIADSTPTKVQHTNEVLDTNGDYDNATNYRYTPSQSGIYLVIASASFNTLPDGASVLSQIYVNGSAVANAKCVVGAGANSSAVASTIVRLNGTTDYVEHYAQQVSGGSLNLQGATTVTYMDITRIGDY